MTNAYEENAHEAICPECGREVQQRVPVKNHDRDVYIRCSDCGHICLSRRGDFSAEESGPPWFTQTSL